MREDINIEIDKYNFINLASKNQYYGNGFIVAPELINNIHKYWKVCERICCLQLAFNVNEKFETELIDETKIRIRKGQECLKFITVINVYAPQTGRLKDNSDELEEMYSQLNDLVEEFQKEKELVFFTGDFNAKVGRNDGTTECLGKYSRGIRNVGQCLVDFCETHDLYVANNAFQNKAAHISTWHKKMVINNKTVKLYTQID